MAIHASFTLCVHIVGDNISNQEDIVEKKLTKKNLFIDEIK